MKWLILGLLLVGIFFTRPFEGSPDFYHHLNSGKQLVTEHTFPYYDELTDTASGHYWIAYAWATGVIYYLLISTFGTISIVFLNSLIVIFIFLLVFILLKHYKISQIPIFLSLFILIPVVGLRFPQRPEVFTYLFIASFLVIDKLRLKEPGIVWLFPILTLAWTNLYGSSTLFGLGLLGLFGIKQLWVDGWKFSKAQKGFYFSILLSILASLLNPNGWNSLFYIWFIPHVASYEGEWAGIFTILTQTPESYILSFQYLILTYLIYLGLFLVVVAFSFKQLKKHPFWAFLSLAIFLPFWAFRQVPLAAILSLPLLAVLLNQKKIYFQLLVLAVGLILFGLGWWLRPGGSLIPQPNSQSDQLIAFLQTHQLSGRAFNHENLGSFLSYRMYPQIKIFFDTRDDLFVGNPAFTDLYNTQMSGKSILPLLDKYQIDLVVADFFTDSLNYKDLFQSSKWSVVYFNDRYFVAVPVAVARAKNLPALPAINPFSPSGANLDMEAQAETYYRLLPPTLSNQLLLVQTLSAQGKHTEAIQILNRLSISNDTSGILQKKQVDYFLAQAYLEINQCNQAGQSLDNLRQDIQGKFIFQPDRKLALIDDDLQAIYFKKCRQNILKGDQYMKQYINRPDVNPIEKIKFQQKYMSL